MQRLSDDVGIFEHAEGATPRRHLGYCLDDVARGLVVVARQPDPTPLLGDLMDRYLAFVIHAQAPDGRCHNRLGLDRRWTDEAGVDDCWGRALWGLGTAAARAGDDAVRPAQRRGVRRSAPGGAAGTGGRWPSRRSAPRRSSPSHPTMPSARALLAAAVRSIGRPTGSRAWPWPEARLTYANAALPEVLIAAGEHLGDARALDDGLQLLGWLVDLETRDGHLSVTPVGGWSLGEHRPGFDQQPIEVAALADALRPRAAAERRRAVGPDRGSRRRLVPRRQRRRDRRSTSRPPEAAAMVSTRTARNENQGAESTLAMIATLQHAAPLVQS